MQAIVTKYLPATNFKGSRIKATCERGSITISYPGELNGDACHIAAVDQLIAKFVKEDAKRYGTNKNPWSKARTCGQMPDGNYAHVFIETFNSPSILMTFKDADDKKHFETFARKARETGGTVAPLWCGIASSVVKRAVIS